MFSRIELEQAIYNVKQLRERNEEYLLGTGFFPVERVQESLVPYDQILVLLNKVRVDHYGH